MVDNNYAINIYVKSNRILILKAKQVRVCKGYLYSNAFHLILFVSYIYRYVSIWISNVSGYTRLFKVRWALNTDSVIFRKNYIWNTLDIDWSTIKILVNTKEIRLPLIYTIPVIHKYKVKRMMNKPNLSFHIMIRKGNMWILLTPGKQ